MELIEHIARSLLHDKGMSDAEIDSRGVSSHEEHHMASMFVKMHAAFHNWMHPVCSDCTETPAEMPNNESDAAPVEEPPADVPDTVDHAESDSVEEDHHEEASPVTSES